MKIKHLILSIIVVTITACKTTTETTDSKKTIITTTNIIANSLKEIVGEELEIKTMMNSEQDPHAYTPTHNDYQLLETATIIVSNGLHLEGKLHETIEDASHKNKNTHIMVSDGLDQSNILFEDGVADPHIWFDINQWSTCINYAVNKLIEMHPEHEKVWKAKLEVFTKKLADLDAKTKTDIGSIPENTRYLVTAHDAFSYFSRAYNIPIKPLQGRNITVEASVTDAIALSDFIVEHKIKAIFVESTVNKKTIESIQESCHSKGNDVVIGGELFADALGPEGTPEATYTGMVSHNVNLIVEALK